jgi:hypothetical protein
MALLATHIGSSSSERMSVVHGCDSYAQGGLNNSALLRLRESSRGSPYHMSSELLFSTRLIRRRFILTLDKSTSSDQLLGFPV